jgi:hypothetical protein
MKREQAERERDAPWEALQGDGGTSTIPGVRCRDCEHLAAALVSGEWFCFRHLKLRAERDEAECAALRQALEGLADAAEHESANYSHTLRGQSVRDADESHLAVKLAVKRARAVLNPPELG